MKAFYDSKFTTNRSIDEAVEKVTKILQETPKLKTCLWSEMSYQLMINRMTEEYKSRVYSKKNLDSFAVINEDKYELYMKGSFDPESTAILLSVIFRDHLSVILKSSELTVCVSQIDSTGEIVNALYVVPPN